MAEQIRSKMIVLGPDTFHDTDSVLVVRPQAAGKPAQFGRISSDDYIARIGQRIQLDRVDQVTGFDDAVREQQAATSAVRSAISELTERTASLEADRSVAEETIEALRGAQRAHTEQIARVSTDLASVRSDIGSVRGDIGRVSDGVEAVDASLAPLGRRVDSVAAAVADLNSRQEAFVAESAAIHSRIDSLNIESDTRFDSVGQSIAVIEPKLRTIETDVAATAAAIAVLGGRIAITEGAQIEHQQSVDVGRAGLLALTQKVEQQAAVISGLAVDIDDLKERLAASPAAAVLAVRRLEEHFAQNDPVTGATYKDIPGLFFDCISGDLIFFEAVLFIDAKNNGFKVRLGGNVAPVNIIYQMTCTNNATGGVATSRHSSLNGEISATIAAACVVISGSVKVSGAGALRLQFAQKSAGLGAATVLTGSYFTVRRV